MNRFCCEVAAQGGVCTCTGIHWDETPTNELGYFHVLAFDEGATDPEHLREECIRRFAGRGEIFWRSPPEAYSQKDFNAADDRERFWCGARLTVNTNADQA